MERTGAIEKQSMVRLENIKKSFDSESTSLLP